MTRLFPALSPNSTWPLTRKVVESISLSTMNLVLVVAIWRDLKERGSAFKGVGPRRIRDQGIGAMRWTISSVIGTGPSLSVLVGSFFSFSHTMSLSLLSGTLLPKKYTNALTQSATHTDEFAALCVSIPKDTLDSWTAKILSWERDRNQPNPYFNPSSGMSGSWCVAVVLNSYFIRSLGVGNP